MKGETLVCSICGECKALWKFNMGTICHSCKKQQSMERYKLLLSVNTIKTCIKCKQSLPLEKYQHDRDTCCSCVQDNEPGRVLYRQTKQSSVCAECGYSDWRALEFAHFDAKTKYRSSSGTPTNISTMGTVGRITEELKKGRFLCANCHRKETYKDCSLDNYLTGRGDKLNACAKLVLKEKINRKECKDCKLEFSQEMRFVFEFDHLPQHEKLFNIAYGVSGNKTQDELIAEMKKCEMVCANCHRIRTYERIQKKKRLHALMYMKEHFLSVIEPALEECRKKRCSVDSMTTTQLKKYSAEMDVVDKYISDLREFAQKKNIDVE